MWSRQKKCSSFERWFRFHFCFYFFVLPISSSSSLKFFSVPQYLCGSFRFCVFHCLVKSGMASKSMHVASVAPFCFTSIFGHIFICLCKNFVQMFTTSNISCRIILSNRFPLNFILWVCVCVWNKRKLHYTVARLKFLSLLFVHLFDVIFWLFARLVWPVSACIYVCACVCMYVIQIFFCSSFAFTLSFLSP